MRHRHRQISFRNHRCSLRRIFFPVIFRLYAERMHPPQNVAGAVRFRIDEPRERLSFRDGTVHRFQCGKRLHPHVENARQIVRRAPPVHVGRRRDDRIRADRRGGLPRPVVGPAQMTGKQRDAMLPAFVHDEHRRVGCLAHDVRRRARTAMPQAMIYRSPS